MKRFILFHGKRHPVEMGAAEIKAFLSDLAVRLNVSASTQNQALNAIVFLYKRVLRKDLGDFSDTVRAKRNRPMPTVLTAAEVSMVLDRLPGTHRLVVELL